jgi:aminoglycoside 3'-phosphotransferase-2
MIFDDGRFVGFADCGRCGLADKYHALALASCSIGTNDGDDYVASFFAAYGLPAVDEAALSYYRPADESF